MISFRVDCHHGSAAQGIFCGRVDVLHLNLPVVLLLDGLEQA